jgi:hypothetical protein
MLEFLKGIGCSTFFAFAWMGRTSEYVVSTSTMFPSVSIYLIKITLYITSLYIALILIDRFFDLLDNWNIVESNNADEESVQMVVARIRVPLESLVLK